MSVPLAPLKEAQTYAILGTTGMSGTLIQTRATVTVALYRVL